MHPIIKTVIVLIGILALAFLGYHFLFSSPAPATQTPPPPQSYGGFGNLDTTYQSPPPSGEQTQAQAGGGAADFETAYQSLMAQLGATPVELSSLSATSSADAKAIYSLYAADIAEQKHADAAAGFDIEAAFVDLNGDGAPEALVYESLPYFCGTGGCSLDIYQKEKGKWTKLASVLASGPVALTNTLANGYLDLYIVIQVPGDTNQSVVALHRWNGSTYVPVRVAATWNGYALLPTK